MSETKASCKPEAWPCADDYALINKLSVEDLRTILIAKVGENRILAHTVQTWENEVDDLRKMLEAYRHAALRQDQVTLELAQIVSRVTGRELCEVLSPDVFQIVGNIDPAANNIQEGCTVGESSIGPPEVTDCKKDSLQAVCNDVPMFTSDIDGVIKDARQCPLILHNGEAENRGAFHQNEEDQTQHNDAKQSPPGNSCYITKDIGNTGWPLSTASDSTVVAEGNVLRKIESTSSIQRRQSISSNGDPASAETELDFASLRQQIAETAEMAKRVAEHPQWDFPVTTTTPDCGLEENSRLLTSLRLQLTRERNKVRRLESKLTALSVCYQREAMARSQTLADLESVNSAMEALEKLIADANQHSSSATADAEAERGEREEAARHELEILRDILEGRTLHLERVMHKAAQFEEELENSRQECSNIRSVLEKTTEELNAIKSERMRLADEVSVGSAVLERMEGAVDELQQKLGVLQSKYEESVRQEHNMNLKIEALQSHNEDLLRQKEDSDHRNVKLSDELSILSVVKEQLTDQLQSAITERDDLAEEVSEVSSALEKLSIELQQAEAPQGSNTPFTTDCKEQRQKLDAAEKAIESYRLLLAASSSFTTPQHDPRQIQSQESAFMHNGQSPTVEGEMCYNRLGMENEEIRQDLIVIATAAASTTTQGDDDCALGLTCTVRELVSKIRDFQIANSVLKVSNEELQKQQKLLSREAAEREVESTQIRKNIEELERAQAVLSETTAELGNQLNVERETNAEISGKCRQLEMLNSQLENQNALIMQDLYLSKEELIRLKKLEANNELPVTSSHDEFISTTVTVFEDKESPMIADECDVLVADSCSASLVLSANDPSQTANFPPKDITVGALVEGKKEGDAVWEGTPAAADGLVYTATLQVVENIQPSLHGDLTITNENWTVESEQSSVSLPKQMMDDCALSYITIAASDADLIHTVPSKEPAGHSIQEKISGGEAQPPFITDAEIGIGGTLGVSSPAATDSNCESVYRPDDAECHTAPVSREQLIKNGIEGQEEDSCPQPKEPPLLHAPDHSPCLRLKVQDTKQPCLTANAVQAEVNTSPAPTSTKTVLNVPTGTLIGGGLIAGCHDEGDDELWQSVKSSQQPIKRSLQVLSKPRRNHRLSNSKKPTNNYN